MRYLKFYISIIISLCIFSATSLLAQPIEEHFGCHFNKNQIKLQPLTQEEKNYLKMSSERSDTIDVLNYNITLDVTDFQGQTIKGICEITFTPKMNNVNHILLDLLQLEVDSVYFQGESIDFTYDGVMVDALLGSNLNVGDTESVTIYYQGHPDADSNNGGFGGFAFDQGIAYNLGIGLNSNPYNNGKTWFPCFDTFVEWATYDLNIITSDGKKAYCIGTFLEESVITGDTIMRSYSMTQPLPTYLVGVAVGNYIVTNQTHSGAYGDIPVQLIARQTQVSDMVNEFQQLGNSIDAFEAWFGPYNWERVGFIVTIAGAMEHCTSIAYPQFTFGNPNYPIESQNRLMAHELAHHWWGNVLTLSSPSNMWIKEGNAEYSAHLFTEYAFGRDYFLDVVIRNHKNVMENAHTDEEDGDYLPLSGIPFEHTYGMTTYNKGAVTMHTLRGYLGDTLFSSGMTHLLETFQYQSINAEQFRDELSASTGVDLTSFFEDWIFSPGWADYEIDSVNVVPSGNEYEATVYVQQKLRHAPHFHTNVPLDITFYDKNWNSHTASIMVSGEFSEVNLTIPFAPDFQLLNDDQKLNLARFQSSTKITEDGSSLLPYVGLGQFQVEELPDSALTSVVHHWVAPDGLEDNPNEVQISSTHYWSYGGIIPEGFLVKARLEYLGNHEDSFDYDLTQGYSEDSIILVYRPNPGEPWGEYPYYEKKKIIEGDGKGLMIIDEFLPGDYTFAKGVLPLATPIQEVTENPTFNIFPNPASEVLFLEGDLPNNAKNIQIEIFTLSGKLLLQQEVEASNFIKESISLEGINTGSYFVKIKDKDNLWTETQRIVVVK